MILPLLAGAAALMLLGSPKKASALAPPRASAPAVVRRKPRVITTRPKSAAKSAPKSAARVKMGPAKILKSKPAKAAQPSSISAPLARSPSQGGGPGLAAPLSADIPSDYVAPAAKKPVARVVPLKRAAQRPGTAPKSPSGYKPDAARRGAPALANHLRRKGKAGYDRRMLKTWQTQAGLPADGLYGPASRGALIAFGQKDPPAAFIGTGTLPYTPR